MNYRIYDKSEGKTKNDYFQERLADVLEGGLKPAFATGDSWYSCTTHLKTVKNHHMGFLFAIESNRTVSIQTGEWTQVKEPDLPDDGLIVWLRHFGEVKRFRTPLKDQLRHDVVHLTDAEQLHHFDRNAFWHHPDHHWKIEQYHRVIKQVCHIERFQVRQEVAIRNPLFAALCG